MSLTIQTRTRGAWDCLGQTSFSVSLALATTFIYVTNRILKNTKGRLIVLLKMTWLVSS